MLSTTWVVPALHQSAHTPPPGVARLHSRRFSVLWFPLQAKRDRRETR